MNDVREGPGHGRGEDGNAEKNEVQNGDRSEVAQPHAPRVEPGGVGVSDGCR